MEAAINDTDERDLVAGDTDIHALRTRKRTNEP